jgi:hypothetical protein
METKLQIIETEDYVLAVSDEDASNSYIYFTGDPTGIFRTGIKYKNGAGDYFYQDAITGMSNTYLAKISKKIIGYQPKGNAPELDLPLLPEMVVEDEVKKLTENYTKGGHTYCHEKTFVEQAFISGYKAATKTYSEEDLIKTIAMSKMAKTHDGLIDMDAWISNGYEGATPAYTEDEIIQSLKQPKTPKWFVAEMGKIVGCKDPMICLRGCNISTETCKQPVLDFSKLKTTTINNKTYLVGTYLFE